MLVGLLSVQSPRPSEEHLPSSPCGFQDDPGRENPAGKVGSELEDWRWPWGGLCCLHPHMDVNTQPQIISIPGEVGVL